jgi:DNA-binding transcriptional regulator YdaS (Cro superfamily)
MPRDWPQLDAEALGLMHTWLAGQNNSRAALARHLGVSRSGISQALDGRYPGNTKHLRALVMERLADLLICPHTAREITPADCRTTRERSLAAASGSRTDVKQWQACQACLHNPLRKSRAATGEVVS